MELKTYLQQNYSPTSIYNYEKAIERYVLYMQGESVTVGYPVILNYMAHLRKQKLHPKTLKNHLLSIKIYYNYLIEIKQRNDHPCKTLYLKDQINRSISVESLYSLQSMELYLQQHKNNHHILQIRDEVIITLLIYQGMTAEEITKLESKDIDLRQGMITIQSKKTTRHLPLKTNQIMLLHTYMNETRTFLLNQNNTDILILSALGKPLAAASINRLLNRDKKYQDKMSPQKIRQSVIAQLLKQNNDIRMVQAFAGHKRIGTTESYKQSGLEALKASIEQLHPLQ
jgi:site-specific recombinase XerD